MQTRIAGRLETGVRSNLCNLGEATRFDLYASAKTVAVRARAYSSDSQPVAALAGSVAKQKRGTVQHAHQQVFPAVVKEVSRGGAAGHVTAGQSWSGAAADLFEFSVLQIVKQQRPLGVGHSKGMSVDLRIHVTIGD